jgi:bifunctional non-homologous end joining protein LigD
VGLPVDIMKTKEVEITPARVVSADSFFKENKLTGNIDLKIGRDIVSVTHLEKVYWPEEGHTKGDLLKYYYDIAKYILPYLKDRPLILKRFPNGIKKPLFFQHNLEDAPDYVETISLAMEVGHNVNYAICNNIATLLYLANLGTIPQNSWSSRSSNVETPDWVVLDLDPKETDFTVVCEVAMAVKELLDHLGLESYPKTSGSSGIHIFIPINPEYDFDTTAAFGGSIATLISNEFPTIATRERSPAKRKLGQVYVDFLQNGYGKSITAAYSVREKPGATVSAPLEWSEVEKAKIKISDFTIQTMPRRVAKVGDLFGDVLRKKQKLEPATAEIEKLMK